MSPSSAPLPGMLFVRALVLEPVFDRFADEEGRIAILLHRAGLSPDVFQDRYATIPLSSYLTVFELAAEMAGDPCLGARLGFDSRPGTLAPIGLRAAQAATIRRGLEALARFTSALQTGTRVTLDPVGADLALTYMITAPVAVSSRQDAEFTLATVAALIRRAFNPRWRPQEVHFCHRPPPDPAPIERLFGAPVRFGQEANRLLLSATEADRVHRSEDPDMIALIERHLSDMIGAAHGPAALRDEVDALIGLYLGVRPVDLGAISAALGLTPRSLQRRLADEGHSVSGLLQAHRQRRAETMLRDLGMSVEAVALALGYSDGTAFWRAHRRWTGQGPRQVKAGAADPA